jgi:hypothetical protein
MSWLYFIRYLNYKRKQRRNTYPLDTHFVFHHQAMYDREIDIWIVR